MFLLSSEQMFHESELIEADEVIQPSSLRDYRWPEEDPRTVDQPVRTKTESDVQLVMQAAQAVTLDPVAFAKNTRSLNVAEKVHYILTHQRFQVNPSAQVRAEELWKDRINAYVSRDVPILIVYPLMCKIGNWAKQMSNVGPTAGEEATVFFFAHLNSLVKTVYPPGLEFAIVSDAALYNSAFCNPAVEVMAYMDGVREIIRTYGGDFVRFYDYVELLSDYSSQYTSIHQRYQRLMCDHPEYVLEGIRAKTLFESVKASINIRKFGMSYQDMRELFSRDSNEHNRQWSVVDTMSRLAMEELVATRKACMELNYFEKRWPGNIRASCHKDKKEGRWVIALRPHPEYFKKSKLLAYHGVPVIRRDEKNKIKMDIAPEVMMRSRLNLVRVENEEGEVYFYDATEAVDPSVLDNEYHPIVN